MGRACASLRPRAVFLVASSASAEERTSHRRAAGRAAYTCAPWEELICTHTLRGCLDASCWARILRARTTLGRASLSTFVLGLPLTSHELARAAALLGGGIRGGVHGADGVI